MQPNPPSHHAVTFMTINVLSDMIVFGLIIPVLPGLIGKAGNMSQSQAAVFGMITAAFQGLLKGSVVARSGEYRVALAGLVFGLTVVARYGMVGSLAVVLILLVVHRPKGFVHPMLTQMRSKAVPDDSQGELQAGISAVMKIAMLRGAVFFSQIFGYLTPRRHLFNRPTSRFSRPPSFFWRRWGYSLHRSGAWTGP